MERVESRISNPGRFGWCSGQIFYLRVALALRHGTSQFHCKVLGAEAVALESGSRPADFARRGFIDWVWKETPNGPSQNITSSDHCL
jgi:hypothetical protein